jgi:hypothetical protein
MNAGWIIPFINLEGAPQSRGTATNGQLDKHIVNPFSAPQSSATAFPLLTSCRFGWTRVPNRRGEAQEEGIRHRVLAPIFEEKP